MTTAMGLFLVGYSLELLAVFVGGLVVMGVSHGILRPASASAAGNALAPEFFGVGMATMRMTSQLGGAVGISVAVTARSLGGFGAFYVVGIGVAATAVAATTFIISQRHPATDAERATAEEKIETEAALTTMPAFEG
jgi:hypothetical protein